MKSKLSTLFIALLACITVSAQGVIEGTCGKDVAWTFDGKTLSIQNVSKKDFYVKMDNYSTKGNLAPWVEDKLDVRNVRIGTGIKNIGSCAFANLNKLVEVVFEDNSIENIEWGAFYNCKRLSSISIPNTVRKIGTIAFANCFNLNSVRIPDQCLVQEQAFLNCVGVRSIEVSPTATLGNYVFASETTIDDNIRHTLYNYEVSRLPAHINTGNCHNYGLSKDAVDRYSNGKRGGNNVDYDYITSEVDSIIPNNQPLNQNTYALIIGNQNYRFVGEVPYAIHDARVFRDYCEKTIGVPAANIHVVEDATKQLIMEDEMGWLESIRDRENKKLIIYYAGHGVPDTKMKNKAYILPTDVRGTKPQNGISLDEFYGRIGDLAFDQTAIFLDACFSGINRDNESVNEGMRGVEIEAEEGKLSSGNVVVFSAAQGNETAQGFQEQGHGLFTYYLLKNIQQTSGVIYFGDLADNLKQQVSNQALQMKLRKPQTPSTNATGNLTEEWRYLTF